MFIVKLLMEDEGRSAAAAQAEEEELSYAKIVCDRNKSFYLKRLKVSKRTHNAIGHSWEVDVVSEGQSPRVLLRGNLLVVYQCRGRRTPCRRTTR